MENIWQEKSILQWNKKHKICVKKICLLGTFFLANFNIFQRFYGLCLWGSDPLNDSFYQILSFKGSEPHKQRPYNLLLMFFVSIKSIPRLDRSSSNFLSLRCKTRYFPHYFHIFPLKFLKIKTNSMAGDPGFSVIPRYNTFFIFFPVCAR